MQHSSISERYTTALHAICEIAERYHQLDRFDDAQCICKAGLQLSESQEIRPQDRLALLLQYAKIVIEEYFLTNQDDDLIRETLQSAQEIAEAIHDEQGRADVLALLGRADYYKTMNSGQGKYEDALASHQQALAIRETLQDTRGISESLFEIGLVFERRGQSEQACSYYIQAREIAKQYGHKSEQSDAARHLGGIALDREQLEAALAYVQESLALRQGIDSRRYLAFAHAAVGDVTLAQGDLAAALYHYRQALSVAEEMQQKHGILFALMGLGDLYLAQHELAQARACYEQARALAQESQISYAIEETAQRLARLSS